MTIRRIKKEKKWTFLKCILSLYLIAGLFTLVWFRTEVVSLEYELGELIKQKAELTRELGQVTAKRANFYSASNVEYTAVNLLGMKTPERENIIFVGTTAGAGVYTVSRK